MPFDKNICSKLTKEQYGYLVELEQFINAKIYFYGSIEREDYFIGKSDLDIDIITPNIHSTLFKLRQFIGIPNHEVLHVKWKTYNPQEYNFECLKIKHNNGIVNLEISIYDEKYRNKLKIVRDFKRNMLSPFLVYSLIMIKFFYYHLNLLSNSQMKEIKRYVMNDLCGHKDEYFAVKNT